MSLAPTAFVPSAGLVVLGNRGLGQGPLSVGLSTPEAGSGQGGSWQVLLVSGESNAGPFSRFTRQGPCRAFVGIRKKHFCMKVITKRHPGQM